MTELEEVIIYDAMIAIQENASVIAALVNKVGTDSERNAYKEGMYDPCIKLQCILGKEAIDHGKARHEQMDKELEAFLKIYKNQELN